MSKADKLERWAISLKITFSSFFDNDRSRNSLLSSLISCYSTKEQITRFPSHLPTMFEEWVKGQWKNVHVIYASSNNDNAARDRNNSTKWNGCCAANLRQRGGKLNCERMIMRILYKAPEYDVKRTVNCQGLFYKVKVKLNAQKLTKMISRISYKIVFWISYYFYSFFNTYFTQYETEIRTLNGMGVVLL